MKQKMNQVTPKAGTLKQTSWKLLQNVSTKLIASVLMLAVIALTPVSLIAGIKNGDTCCKTSKAVDFPKNVSLILPSSEMVKKADSEMNRNLYKSLRESKINRFAKLFAAADAEINWIFKGETTVSSFSAVDADETMISNFAAEHISRTFAANADTDINDIFTAENVGIKGSWASVNADDQINTLFNAENINMPGQDSFGKADQEIHQNMMNDQAVQFAANSAK
jgi:hypothetical protein